jgi:Tol biopolymer transport system component
MQTINTDTLNYAPATSVSGLEIFFTRLEPEGPAIYVASRKSTSEPFGEPRKIQAITGFVEGPTLSPNEKSLYYHKKENGRFVIYRVTRP